MDRLCVGIGQMLFRHPIASMGSHVHSSLAISQCPDAQACNEIIDLVYDKHICRRNRAQHLEYAQSAKGEEVYL